MTRLLIVEDNQESLYMLQVLLSASGYELDLASNGAEALEQARRRRPDLIISDILMPGMDGFAFCRACKQDEQLKEIPFVFYTATYTEPKDEEFALSLGAERFIIKPLEPAPFLTMLEETLAVHAAGKLATRRPPATDDVEFHRQHSATLIAKLEEKVSELEEANRQLAREIADRQQAEEARRAAEAERTRLIEHVQEQAEQMREIMDAVPEGVLLLDTAGRILLANPAASALLPVITDGALGETISRLGDRALVELLTSPPRGLWHEVRSEGRFFQAIARPVESGPHNRGWVLVLRDVTIERERQRQAQQQERLAAVGQLAAGIAHDFNNIMAVIVLNNQLTLRDPSLPPAARDRLSTAVSQAGRASDLIAQILDFGRQTPLETRPVSLVPLLKEQVKLLDRTLPESIAISLDCQSSDLKVNGDPGRLQQVIMNLALNARDALAGREGGSLRFSLSELPPDSQITCFSCGPVLLSGSPWVRLSVTDTGSGIPPDVLPHIFEPFFTTKARGEGNGLGLAQVYGIVRQHDGHLQVSTQVSQGTTFAILLPTLAADEQPGAQLAKPSLREGRGQTVLVVENEPRVRQAVADGLQTLGYRVLLAQNGLEALESAAAHAIGLDLVLTDMVMPEMGGAALVHALRQRGLDVPIIMMSGYLLESKRSELAALGVVAFLQKPVNLEVLSTAVADALHGSA